MLCDTDKSADYGRLREKAFAQERVVPFDSPAAAGAHRASCFSGTKAWCRGTELHHIALPFLLSGKSRCQRNGNPYPNRLSLDGALGKDWPPFYDSLYRVLRHDQLKSCEIGHTRWLGVTPPGGCWGPRIPKVISFPFHQNFSPE